jgi:hypothetical protein
MKRASAAEALTRVDLVCGEILLGRGTVVAKVGGWPIKVREKEDVAMISQFRLIMPKSVRAAFAVLSASSSCQIPE